MPLPALAVAAASKAMPWIGGIVGSMLPAIVDSFRSGKTPEEAQAIIAPKRQEIVDRLIGTGMNQAAAEAMADESLRSELAQAQLPEPMNPWLSGALALGGGIAGGVGGYKLGKRMAGPAPAAPKPEPDVYKPGFVSPRRDAIQRGSEDRVTGVREPARIGMSERPAPAAADEARALEAEIVDQIDGDSGPFPKFVSEPYDYRSGFVSPSLEAARSRAGIVRGPGFTMRPDAPFPRVGMSPETGNRLTADELRQRLYRYEGG